MSETGADQCPLYDPDGAFFLHSERGIVRRSAGFIQSGDYSSGIFKRNPVFCGISASGAEVLPDAEKSDAGKAGGRIFLEDAYQTGKRAGTAHGGSCGIYGRKMDGSEPENAEGTV